MLRKQFKKSLLAALVVAYASLTPSTEVMAQRKSSGGKSGPTASNIHAAIWAETAKFSYNDEPNFDANTKRKLIETIDSTDLEKFRSGLDTEIAKRKVSAFRERFINIENQSKNANPDSLVASIIAALKNKYYDGGKLKKGVSAKREEAFVAFSDKLNAIPNSVAPTGITKPVPGSAGDDAHPIDSVETVAGGGNAPAAPAPDSTSTWVSWVALAFGLLSSFGVGYLLLTRNGTGSVVSIPPSPSEPNRLSGQSHHEREKALADSVRSLVQQEFQKQRAIEQKTEVNGKPTMAAAPSPPPFVNAPQPEQPPLPVPTPGPKLQIQYVNEAPFNDSFRAHALSDQPGSYSIFAVEYSEQQPDQGTFSLTGNLASHVRNHRNALEPVCEYVSYPTGNETRIVTECPGRVRRRGQDWEVVSHARIRFEG